MEIKQINVKEFDERFYQLGDKFAPSVTHILQNVYPTSFGLIDWIGNVGNRRAEEIRNEAGDVGTYVHNKIELLLKGGKTSKEEIEDRFNNKSGLKVKRCLKAFLDWHEEYKPTTKLIEHIVWNKEMTYAGTLDYVCDIAGETWIVDFKTSNDVHASHKVQLSAYNYAETGGTARQAILHLGNSTKKRYSFLEVEFKKYFEQFKVANNMFQTLFPDAKPNEETFPEYFTLIKKDNK